MKNKINDGINAKGFFRLKIVEDEEGRTKVKGDTGWMPNQITNLGKDQYLAQLLGHMAGSKYVSYAALGTGTAPASDATALPGELGDASNCRMAVTPTTTNASGTVQFAFTLNSNIVTASRAISNVGLFDASVTQVGTVFAGNTYASSALAKIVATSLAIMMTKFRKLQGTLKNVFETICSEISNFRETFNDYNRKLQFVGVWNSLFFMVT